MQPGTPALEERDQEVASLTAALDEAVAGQGRLALVTGPAGIGKTRLLRELRDRAERAAIPVLSARAGDGERDFAHGVVRQLVERRVLGAAAAERELLLQGAAGLAAPILGVPAPPEVPGLDAPDPSFAALHGLYWLVANLAAGRGLVLIVDDAHWADVPSLRFLAYLARRLDGVPVLVAVAARPGGDGPERDVLDGLFSEPDALVLHPGALSVEAVARVAAAVFGCEPEPDFADAVHQAAGGVPFYVAELVRALSADGVPPVAGECDRVRALGPPTVTRSVLLRVAALPRGAGAIASALATLQTDATLPRVAALAGEELDAAARGVDALVGAGLLAADGQLAFAHPIVAAAVVSELGPGERGRLHARAAALLHDEGADSARVAPHLLATPPDGAAWVVGVLRSAGSSAVGRGAPEIAVRELRRALAEPPPEAQRADVLGELGGAELRAGDPAALEHLRAAVAAPGRPAGARAADAQLMARALTAAGRAAEVVEALGALADAVRVEDEDAARLLDGDLAAIALLDVAAAAPARRRLERHTDVRGVTRAERLVLVSLAQQSWVAGTSAAATRDLARRALGDGRLLAEETTDSVAYAQAVFALVVADGSAEALGHLAVAAQEAERRGSLYGYASTSMLAAIAHLRTGDVLATEVAARASVEVGEHAIITPSARAFLAYALIDRGRLDEAEEVLAGQPDPLPAAMPSNHVAYARGMVALLRGRRDDAEVALTDAGAREAAFGIVNPVMAWRLLLAGAVARRGDLARARALVDEQARIAARWGSPALLATARRAQALWVAPADQPAALQEAVRLARAGIDRLDLARALVDLGAALRRSNERVAARAPLIEALELARRLGGRQVAERAHRELQVAGARPRRLQFSGVEALTAAERRVVELAARGRSNREIAEGLFVTAKTVENHLGRAYRKLGVGARDELAGVLVAQP